MPEPVPAPSAMLRAIVLRRGLLAGAIMCATLLVTLTLKERLDFDAGAVVGYASMIVAFTLVYFGVRAWRDEVAGGEVSFGRAFGVGMAIVLVASACYVVVWEVVFFNFMPDFMTRYQAHVLDGMRAAGASAAALAAKEGEMARFAVQYRNPLFNAAVTLLEPLPVGVLAALLSAALLRRRGPRAAGEAPLARAV